MANGNGLAVFKEKLRKVKKILFTKHAVLRCDERELTQAEIEDSILNAKNLFKVISQKADLSYEEKHRLYFRLSRNKTLVAVILLENEILYVVTAFIKYRRLDNKVKICQKRRW
jgi:hypothetical protein